MKPACIQGIANARQIDLCPDCAQFLQDHDPVSGRECKTVYTNMNNDPGIMTLADLAVIAS